MSVDVILADAEAEKVCLSTMFLKKGALLQASERLQPSDFYFEHHRLYFKALSAFARDGEAPNIITLKNKLVERGLFDRAGGDSMLLDIISGYVAYEVNGVLDAIIQLSKRRRAKAVAEAIFRRCDQYTENVDELLAEADEKLRVIRMDRSTGIITMRQLCDITVDDLANVGELLPTPYQDLDYLDIMRPYYIILAARTSKGKTALALNLAEHVARTKPVLYFTLEMKPPQLRNRIVSTVAGVDERRVRTKEISRDEMIRLDDALEYSRRLQLEIVVKKRYIEDICTIARARHQENPLGLIVIDYVQKAKTRAGKNLNRQQQLAEISGEIQELTNDLEICVLALAQLSRTADSKEPDLVDLRESGDLEQDCDVAMFLQEVDTTGTIRRMDLLVKKNRSGPLGTVELLFDRSVQQFKTF